MERILIGLLAALLLIGSMSDASAAARGKRFHDGLKNPAELAALIEASLAQDPTGRRMLNPARCSAPHWSCAAPIDYLVEIQKANPAARVNGEPLRRVDQLPAHLRTLVRRTPPTGKYWMACMVPAPKSAPTPSGYVSITRCVARSFHKNEQAWVDPATGKPELAEDCTNPVIEPTPDACVYLVYDTDPTQGDAEVHMKQYGPTDVSDDPCTALLRAGETEWESPAVERCYNPQCTFAGADRVVGDRGHWTGSHSASAGRNVLSLPAVFAQKDSSYRMFFCLKREGWAQTCAVGVRWFNYLRDTKTGRKVATIHYTQDRAEAAQKKSHEPFTAWWAFDWGKFCNF